MTPSREKTHQLLLTSSVSKKSPEWIQLPDCQAKPEGLSELPQQNIHYKKLQASAKPGLI